MSGWSNRRDYHNNLIPYEFPDIAALCTNHNRPYDDYVDYYVYHTDANDYAQCIKNFEIQSEILAHLRVRTEEPTRPYQINLSMCCTTDHRFYRAYWEIEWRDR